MATSKGSESMPDDTATTPSDEHSEPVGSGEGNSVAPKTDRAVAAGYPADSGPEERVMVVNQAMIRARPLLFFGYVLVGLAAAVGMVWFGLFKDPPWAWAGWTCLGIVAAVIGSLGVWKVSTMMRRLEITNKRTVRQVGLFSRDSSEVLHDNIRNFTVKQSMWERLWGVGEIGIASSGQDDVEITMARVPNPRKVQKIIDLYRPLG